jgi:SPP1 family predicted phage head-tail adaptor
MPQTNTIGSMTQRVEIHAPQEDQEDVYGQVRPNWSIVARCWARIEEQAGQETVHADEITAERRIMVTIRWRTGITPRMRLIWHDEEYGIESIRDPDGRQRLLELACRGKA